MSRTWALGIDTGKEGYVALVDQHGQLASTWATPLLTSEDYDAAAMLSILRNNAPLVALCALEEPITVRDQHPQSALVAGRGHGLWLALLTACSIPYERVEPSAWKKVMGCWIDAPKTPRGQGLKARTGLGRDELMQRVGTIRRRIKEGHVPTEEERVLVATCKTSASNSAARKKAAKEASIERAHALFPGVDFRANERCRVPHDGKVEASLLALFALRRAAGRA